MFSLLMELMCSLKYTAKLVFVLSFLFPDVVWLCVVGCIYSAHYIAFCFEPYLEISAMEVQHPEGLANMCLCLIG